MRAQRVRSFSISVYIISIEQQDVGLTDEALFFQRVVSCVPVLRSR